VETFGVPSLKTKGILASDALNCEGSVNAGTDWGITAGIRAALVGNHNETVVVKTRISAGTINWG
jgi:hypothetical protein